MLETNPQYLQPDSDNKDYPLVSVIINCYNGERYLREAIDSVRDQTYSNWELIFWDNQSTDSSAEICQSYNDSRIHYFYAPEHTLLGCARNLAVEKAQGTWIAFLDCDDTWLTHKLEEQVKIVSEETDELGLIYTQAEIKFESLKKSVFTSLLEYSRNTLPSGYNKFLPEGRVFDLLACENFIPFSTVLINRKFYLKVGGSNQKYRQAEDYDVCLKISAIAKLRALSAVHCYYRVHDLNLSHNQIEVGLIEWLDILRQFSNHRVYLTSVRSANTRYAIYFLHQKQWRKGVEKLFRSGSLWILSMIIFRKIWYSLTKVGF